MANKQLEDLLSNYISDPAERRRVAEEAARRALSDQINGALLDLDRQRRCGFPEVIYGEGKPTELILRLIRHQQSAGQPSLVTRCSDESRLVVHNQYPDAIINDSAATIRIAAGSDTPQAVRKPRPIVPVITAGSCDRPVAEEARETLLWMHCEAPLYEDVGVAGPQRLLSVVHEWTNAAVVIVCAGMEAALPSVVGGFVRCPVIGCPTSVGYGASAEGMTALHSILSCCASNVVAVNVDAGFRAGYVAGLIATGPTIDSGAGQSGN